MKKIYICIFFIWVDYFKNEMEFLRILNGFEKLIKYNYRIIKFVYIYSVLIKVKINMI